MKDPRMTLAPSSLPRFPRPDELALLAKTGHGPCRGSGMVNATTACRCVRKGLRRLPAMLRLVDVDKKLWIVEMGPAADCTCVSDERPPNGPFVRGHHPKCSTLTSTPTPEAAP